MLISIIELFWNICWTIYYHFWRFKHRVHNKNKLQSLHQGPHLTIVYSYEFRHLTCDISWNEVAFVSQFQFGLHSDVTGLLLTMLDPTTLNQTLPKLFNVIISFLNEIMKNIRNYHHSQNNSWPSHHPYRWCLHQRMIPSELVKHDSNHSWNKKNKNDIYTIDMVLSTLQTSSILCWVIKSIEFYSNMTNFFNL